MAKFEFNDVANYQPDTLAYFQGLKSKGSGAVIVKITQGTGYINPKATNQVNHADQAGLRTAGYHYAMFGGNVAQAHAEANYFLKQAGARLAKGSILALDYEDAATTGSNKNANANAIIAFMNDVKNAGYIPWFYTGKYFIAGHVNHDAVNRAFPNTTWIAGYPGTSYPDFNYFPSVEGVVAWQYTNNWKGLGLDGSTLLLDWPEGKSAPQVSKAVQSKPASSSKPATSSNYGLNVGAHVQPRWEKSEAGRVWQLDAVSKQNGIWQGAEYLESGKGFTWTDNGIPLSFIDLTDKNGKKLSNQSNAGKGSYFKYNTYFKIKKQGTDPRNGNMSYIVPDGKPDNMGFWVVTKYLQ